MSRDPSSPAPLHRSLLGRAIPLLALCVLACSPPMSPPTSDHVRIGPLSRVDGVSIGMDASDFRSIYPELDLARYEGYSDSTSAMKTTFVFSDPCNSDSGPDEDCPVRGKLRYVDVVFGWEDAGGQTLFVETWGEIFKVYREPVYCYRRDVRFQEDRTTLQGMARLAHWDDESGLWATLSELTVPDRSPYSARTRYRIGWGEHTHALGEGDVGSPC